MAAARSERACLCNQLASLVPIEADAGMLPIALGWGAADSSFRSPMPVAVIGGITTSTVLSLLVVPAMFTYIDDLEH